MPEDEFGWKRITTRVYAHAEPAADRFVTHFYRIIPSAVAEPSSHPSTVLPMQSFPVIVLLLAAEWTGFRGPDGAGVSSERSLPDVIALNQNLAWQAHAGKGASSPISDGIRVFITSYDGQDRTLSCLDAASGKLRWRRSVTRLREEPFHAMHGPATPTPVLDGGRVFALFPDFGLIAYDLSGHELWRKPLGPFASVQGYAASPVVADGLVIVVVDTPADSYVAAFVAATGNEAWRTKRPAGILGGYATPIVWRRKDGNLELIVAGSRELTGYLAKTGERIWWGPGITSYPIAPPFVHGDSIYTMEPSGVGWPPFSEPLQRFDKDGDGRVSLAESQADASWLGSLRGIDLNAGNGDGFVTREEYEKAASGQDGGLYRIRLGGSGELSGDQIVWRRTKSIPSFAGALLYGDILYTMRRGILATFDPATGSLIEEKRLPGALGEYYASPVAGDGKIYLASYDGVVSVVRTRREWSVLSTGNLGEAIVATPAIAGGRVFVRTETKLYCFARKRA